MEQEQVSSKPKKKHTPKTMPRDIYDEAWQKIQEAKMEVPLLQFLQLTPAGVRNKLLRSTRSSTGRVPVPQSEPTPTPVQAAERHVSTYLHGDIGGQKTKILIDTGAAICVIAK